MAYTFFAYTMPSRTGPTKFLFFALCLIFAIFGTRRSSNRGVVCGIKFGENAGNERFETDIEFHGWQVLD